MLDDYYFTMSSIHIPCKKSYGIIPKLYPTLGFDKEQDWWHYQNWIPDKHDQNMWGCRWRYIFYNKCVRSCAP